MQPKPRADTSNPFLASVRFTSLRHLVWWMISLACGDRWQAIDFRTRLGKHPF